MLREGRAGKELEESKVLQRAYSTLVPEPEVWVLRLALIMAKVVMFREIFQRECEAIFRETQERFQEGHIDIHILAKLPVVAGRCCRAVGDVLDCIVLHKYHFAFRNSLSSTFRETYREHVQINMGDPRMSGKRRIEYDYELSVLASGAR